jgi:hypothetical protein
MKFSKGVRVKVIGEPMWGFVREMDAFGFVHVACDDGFIHRYKPCQIEVSR